MLPHDKGIFIYLSLTSERSVHFSVDLSCNLQFRWNHPEHA